MKKFKWTEHYKRSNSKSCEGKRVFNSSAEAGSFNHRSARFIRGNKKREHLHVYRCNTCRQWHIGHSPAKEEGHRG